MFKKLFGYKLQIVPKKTGVENASIVDPELNSKDEAVDKKALKKELRQKAKAEKAKAQKTKAAKAKNMNTKKHAKGKARAGKKAPIAASAAALIVGVGVGVFFLLGSGQSASAELLALAHEYTQQGEYERSLEIFDRLIEDDETPPEILVDSHLGLADTLTATGDLDLALVSLQLGYEQTQSPLIGERLEAFDADYELTSSISSSIPIEWLDLEFERMVRIALERPYDPITPNCLRGVTTLKILGAQHATTASGGLNTLNFMDGFRFRGEFFSERGGITHLDDLVNFPNLRMLTVGYNSVVDISGVAHLENLVMLGLYANNITDISPVAQLIRLEHLFLYNNNISDLSPLSGLSELRELSLQYNNVYDLSPIGGLPNLSQLFLSNNNITSLDPLGGLEDLAVLGVQNNAIRYTCTVIANLQNIF